MGPPMDAVISPTGISAGAITVRANKSDIINKKAPANAEQGISFLWSEPINCLSR